MLLISSQDMPDVTYFLLWTFECSKERNC